MVKPKIAGPGPIGVTLEDGKTYFWCTCGRSKQQPFCDGSHQGSGFEPQSFVADRSGKAFLCQCKRTARGPYCDGSHKRITDEEMLAEQGLSLVWYRVGSAGDQRNGEIRAVQAGAKRLALTYINGAYGALDNACPHQGGPLAEGVIDCDDGQCRLRCPWHGWEFDPLSGHSPRGMADSVKTYPVSVRDDGIFVQVQESTRRARTVADVLIETMRLWGVTHVFGMIGHSNLGLADALREQVNDGKLAYIGVRHEGAAAFACSGFAKLSRRPAACLSIAGPGATNLLTGMWDAKVDRAPLLALTGQVDTQVLGPGAFQDIDLAAAFQSVSRFSQTVLPTSRHAELMALALKNALVERDVAHLIVPDEVQVLPVEGYQQPASPDGRLAATDITPSDSALRKAQQAIALAARPVIIVGYGASEAMGAIVALADALHAPVLTTFKAKGQISDHHPLAAGVLGRSGTPVASAAMNRADLLIVFGASFSTHTAIAADKSIIQVDFDRMSLGKFHPVEIPVWGDAALTAQRLTAGLPKHAPWQDQRDEIAKRWQQWRAQKQRRAQQGRERRIDAANLYAALSQHCPENAVIAVDVGENTYSFGRYFECKSQTVLMSGYLGSIGFAYPAALGAWAATQVIEEHANRPVVSISGDGGFAQYLAELTTAVKYAMNITHILLNNSELGKISNEQRAANFPVWETALHNPNFAQFATNCGALGMRVERVEQLDQALNAVLTHNGPALLELIVDDEGINHIDHPNGP